MFLIYSKDFFFFFLFYFEKIIYTVVLVYVQKWVVYVRFISLKKIKRGREGDI
jgi:hypothetical protein